jgi:hypothetical protein
MVKQTPSSHAQPAIIQSINTKNKKVLVYWIYSQYTEEIEMYNRLFSEIVKTRNHSKFLRDT